MPATYRAQLFHFLTLIIPFILGKFFAIRITDTKFEVFCASFQPEVGSKQSFADFVKINENARRRT